MTNSRSPSPSLNLSTTNLSNFPDSTNLRPQPLEERTPEQPTDEYTELLTVHLSPPSADPQLAESSSSRRPLVRPAGDSSEEPMAKRIRRMTPEARDSHSSPSSDSQDDMADNEMDVGKVDRPEPLPTTSAPPKKKRTRTLTTPHQSAVLHALLAQSRFPTTAMREEVGRSIGLSARKVQNQRQKARRPRSQSDTPSTRLPQYGPFPSGPESVLHNIRGYEHGIDRFPYATQSASEAQGGSLERPPRLLGPGMPGAPAYPPQPEAYRHLRPPISAPLPDSRHQMGHTFQRVHSPPPYSSPRMYPHPGTRPATSQPSSWHERDPSRTLPPPVSTRPSSSTYGSRRIYSSGAHPFVPSRPTFIPPRSISPEPRFAHQPPEPTPRPLLHLPPPFTLQPSPQWDESAYTAFPRPSSSAWSRPGSRSTRGRSTSPITSRRDHMGSLPETSDSYYLAEHTPLLHASSPRSMPPASTPPSRSGRYDPVRASFVAFSTPSVSPAVSPARTAGGEPAGHHTPSPSREPR
ncbi:hypothetical protein BDZ97DRAFT_1905083 [Flammula alnicola]|nr:hypothetical protein BDZ97DRAFT_1905083 [Flammula alnicola]